MEQNSSIFNFSRLKAFFTLPWRTQLWHFVLLCGMLGVVAGSSFALRPLAKEKKNPAPDHATLQEAEAILLGNSQYTAIDQKRLSLPLVNLSPAGSDYAVMLALLRHYSPQIPNLKYVLLAFDNLPLRVAAMADRAGDYSDLLQFGLPWYALPQIGCGERVEYGISQISVLRPLLSGPKLEMEYLLNNYLFAKAQAAELLPPPPGFDPMRPKAPFGAAPAQGALKMQDYVRKLTERNNLDNNQRALFEIANLCATAGWKLILIRSPLTPEFIDARPEHWKAELQKIRQELTSNFPQLLIAEWFDERTLPLPHHYFDDPNHLNQLGMRQYEVVLNERIQTLRVSGSASTQLP